MRKNYLLSEELQRLVNRDRLTDVATRDYFFAQLNANPMAYGVSLMVDIDHFKSVNDTYGHFAGDMVIQQVAEILRETIKDLDIVCRFGGEEFVLFLHDHDAKDGFTMAERLREKVAKTKMTYEGEAINVTVSIGGSMKNRIATITAAIKEADEALYCAKQGGRNQTVFAPIQAILKASA
jgi:diguanylate cyclase (GGDEF)-like protein